MNRKLLPLVLLTSLPAFTFAQDGMQKVSPDEPFVEAVGPLFSCDFQDQNTVAQYFVVADLDDLTPTSFMQSIGFGWQTTSSGDVHFTWVANLRDSYSSENYFIGSTSQYEPAGQANDWLMTTPIEIPSTGCTLSWKSESFDPKKRDGLKVFISTAGKKSPSTTDFVGEPIFEVEEEESGPTENLDGEWVEHEVSLDAYAGETINIAFVNQSYDKSLICLDDIMVSFKSEYTIVSEIPTVTEQENVIVRGQIVASGTTTLTSYEVHYSLSDNEVRTQSYSGLSIEPGQSHTFEFEAPLPIDKGTSREYRLWANVPGLVNMGVTGSLSCLSFAPERKVVLEEGTGTWCGYCPQGILAIEHIEELYPDNFIAIGVHQGDAMANDYINYLGLSAFPSGFVNRGSVSYPLKEESGDYTFEAEESFLSDVKKALSELTTVEIHASGEFIKADSMQIQITSNVRFAMNEENLDYRITYALLEDDVKGSQSNYLSTFTNPIFGEWGKGGIYGSSTVKNYMFQDVARGIFPSFAGTKGSIPSSVVMDENYSHTQVIEVPTKVAKKRNLSVVAMVVNNKKGEIMNATKIGGFQISAGVESSISENQTQVALEGSELVIYGNATYLTVTNMAGYMVKSQPVTSPRINVADLMPGVYIVTTTAENGQKSVSKINVQ